MAEEVAPDTLRGWERKNSPLRKPSQGLTCSSKMKELWADPEWRAALIAKRQKTFDHMKATGKRRRNRAGIPQGMNLTQAKRFWRQARFEATLTMKKLEAAGVLDDADTQSKEALHYAISKIKDPTTAPAHGLIAARLILDFTKAKPAQKSEVTINKAEEWLEAVTADNAKAAEQG